ncbi:MAG: helix-turn-helix domain-containing protein [Thermomicrobiales bacterium]
MTDPLPVVLSFRTSDLPADRRFPAWAEISASTHTITRHASDLSAFFMDVIVCAFGDIGLSHGQFSQQVFARSPEHIRRDHLDHFGLFAQGQGTRTLAFGPEGKESVAYPGDLVFFDMHQPGDSLATDGGSGTIYLSRDWVEAMLPAASRQHGTVLRGALPRLVAGHIHAVGKRLMHEAESGMPAEPDIPGASAVDRRLVHTTRDLALACLLDAFANLPDAAARDANAAGALSARDDALRAAVVRHIDAHLTDPALDIPTLCAAFTLSRSALYRLFSAPGDEGIARLIKRRRLARIRAVILAGHDRRTLAEIAADYGFRTAAHFSREFRSVFGYPPGELRHFGETRVLDQAKRTPWLDTIFSTFGDL